MRFPQSLLAPVLTCLLVTMVAVVPFFYIGEDRAVGCCGGEMPITHDAAMHHNQMQGFHRGLVSGRIYPRWDDATHLGYGAPTTSFYPPAIYFLTSILYAALHDWRLVLMGFHLLVMAGSGLAAYACAREWLGRNASLIAMIIYMIGPYHLINQYQRGALSEQMGFVWAPLVLLFAGRFLFRDDLSRAEMMRDVAGLGAAFGAYLWTHPPTAFQLLLLFGPVAIVRIVPRIKVSLMRVSMIGGGLLLGALLAGAYLLPGFVERNLIYSEDVEKVWPYHASYVYHFAQQVYDHSVGGFFWRLDTIWLLHALALAAVSIALFVLRNRLPANLRGAAWWWVGGGLLSIFMMTRASTPIGSHVPFIEIGVYAWRMLTFAGLATALGAGIVWQAAGLYVPKTGRKLRWLLRSGVFALIAIMLWAGYSLAVRPMLRAEAFAPVPGHYNYATLPRGVPRDLPRMEPVEIASGQGTATVERWDPQDRLVRVRLDRLSRVIFRTSYFPGWTATVDGAEVNVKRDENSTIFLDLPAGDHAIALEFRPTPVRRAGDLMTIAGLLAAASVMIIKRRVNKES